MFNFRKVKTLMNIANIYKTDLFMKQLSFLVCFFIIFSDLQAQSDTLRPASFSDSCAGRTAPGGQYIPDLALYINPLGGYICGRSIYGMKTKAQKFYHKGGKLKQVAFLIHKKTQAIFPGVIRVGVYNVDPITGAPDEILAYSSFYSVGNIKSFVNIDSTSNFTIVNFNDTVLLPDTFFIGLDLTLLEAGDLSQGISGDTLGLWSTSDSCFSGEQLAWEEDSNGIWHPFNDGTMFSSWGLDIDMAVFPIGDFGFELVDGLDKIRLREVKIFPNPASEGVFLKGDWNGNVHIKLLDLAGRTVLEKLIRHDKAGIYSLDIRQLEEGLYLYQVHHANYSGNLSGKLIIQR